MLQFQRSPEIFEPFGIVPGPIQQHARTTAGSTNAGQSVIINVACVYVPKATDCVTGKTQPMRGKEYIIKQQI
jgi:hypothetical protein